MRRATPIRLKRRGQDGYALTLVVFLLALIVIASVAAAPDIITNGRREREEEMIWRGKQYVRGIRLFVRYNQMHGGGVTKFPTSMEDLTKNKVGIRFMRQAYKDPVNSVDGSWRLIYVGPNGQLIGSLKDHPLLGSGQPGGTSVGSSSGFGSSFGNNSSGGSSFGSSSFGGGANSSFGNSSFNNGANSSSMGGNNSGANPTGQNATPGTTGDAQSGGGPTDQMSTPQPLAGSDGSTQIIGGNIIGVGSKVNKKSIIWYDKAKNYRQFEFIWDPSKEPVNGGAAAGIVGQPPANMQNGSNSIFSSPGGNGGFGQQAPGTGLGNSNPNPGSGQNPPPSQTPPGQNPPQ